MLHAEEKLHEAILQDYTPWACESVTEKTVNVRQWIAEDEARRRNS